MQTSGQMRNKTRRVSLDPHDVIDDNSLVCKRRRIMTQPEDDEGILTVDPSNSNADIKQFSGRGLKRRVSLENLGGEITDEASLSPPPAKKAKITTSTIACQTELSCLIFNGIQRSESNDSEFQTIRQEYLKSASIIRNTPCNAPKVNENSFITTQTSIFSLQALDSEQTSVSDDSSEETFHSSASLLPNKEYRSARSVANGMKLLSDLQQLNLGLAKARSVQLNLPSKINISSPKVSTRSTLPYDLNKLHRQLEVARRQGIDDTPLQVVQKKSKPPRRASFLENVLKLWFQLSQARQMVPEREQTLKHQKHPSAFGASLHRLWVQLGDARTLPVRQTATKQRRPVWMTVVVDVLLLCGMLMLGLYVEQVRSTVGVARLSPPSGSSDCIYVTGGGFSGFWFSIGRLHSLEHPTNHDFVCYSAGCLGVVATFSNQSMEELYDMAVSIQHNWNDGSLHRFHVVEEFVEQLLDEQHQLTDEMLASIHILTSVPDENTVVGFQSEMQTPKDRDDLKSLLVQTTWIPFAIGSHYTHPESGRLDGAFSIAQHPICDQHVGLANDWDLLTNTLNVNLAPTEAPTANPTAKPTAVPTANPTASPTKTPTATPTANPTASSTGTPTSSPTGTPTSLPTANPTLSPTASPTATPTATPTAAPTAPTEAPTERPTNSPTFNSANCFALISGTVPAQGSTQVNLSISNLASELKVQLCGGGTDFDSSIEVFNGAGTSLGQDDNGCPNGIQSALTITNNPKSAKQVIITNNDNDGSVGNYLLSVDCKFALSLPSFPLP